MSDILIVEDHATERERLEKLFLSAGYSFVSAETAEEAERLIALEQFRLAVLDIGLGDKSGSYLFDYIKRQASIPYVIILTGNPSIHLKQQFIDGGAQRFIVKASPDSESEALLNTVTSLIGNQALENKSGIPLAEFLRSYINEESRALFLDEKQQIPLCTCCGSKDYIISFVKTPQIPPIVEGIVICRNCQQPLDPEVR